MKKFKYIMLVLLFAFMLSVCFCAEGAEYKDEVSVGIKFGANAGTSLTVSSTDNINVID